MPRPIPAHEPDASRLADLPDEIGADAESSADVHLARAYHRSVVVGRERLHRTWPNLLVTGFVGGMDVGVGVLGLLVVRAATGSELLGALAFSIGFMILVLARSELFTENYLVPVTVVVTERRGGWRLLRLWTCTLATNWLGGILLMALVVAALPRTHLPAVEVGSFYVDVGIGWQSFTSAVLAGVLITLMTWIEQATQDIVGKLSVAIATAFLLAAPPLLHSVVGALEMAAGLLAGDAPYGWLDALGMAGWAVFGNTLGGVGLVTVLRLVQVGDSTISEEVHREDPADSARAARQE